MDREGAMNWTEHGAPAEIADLVESFWTLEGDAGAEEDSPTLVPTDGCVELVACLDGTRLGAADKRAGPRRGLARTSWRAGGVAIGMATGPWRFHYQGPVRLAGIRLRPRGAVALLGDALHELTDRVLPLADVLPALAREVQDATEPLRGGARSADGRALSAGGGARLLSASIPSLAALALRPLHGSEEHLTRALEVMDRSRGRLPISAASERAGLSTRQIDRFFERWVGLTPKTYARIARFRRAWAMSFEQPRMSWATIALDCGYADQAHLCREFRRLGGVSPQEARRSGAI
jgi:AraC-like DNA-binding protein